MAWPRTTDMGKPRTRSPADAPASAATFTGMHEIRLVGRGGQGVVTAGDLLGRAALLEGRHSQSLPTFGPERRGALSQCSLRISDEPILLKCSSTSPDTVLVLDPTIWHHFNVLLGAKAGATLVFNTPESPESLDEGLRNARHGYRPPCDDYALYTVDATGIALEVLSRPITNTAMMGALAAATGVLSMDSVGRVLEDRFGDKAPPNIDAARAAFERILAR